MKPEEVPAELRAIVDRAAGREHSATGVVMACLAEVLAAYERQVRERVAAEIEDARGPRPRGSALPDFAGAAYDHAARIARGEAR